MVRYEGHIGLSGRLSCTERINIAIPFVKVVAIDLRFNEVICVNALISMIRIQLDISIFRLIQILEKMQFIFSTVESNASQIFSAAPKIMFQASGGFYNTRAFQSTLNQGHTMRRKKYAMKTKPV